MENYQLHEFLKKTASESCEFKTELIMASDNIAFLQFLEAKRTLALENIAGSLNRLVEYNNAGNSASDELRIMNSSISYITSNVQNLCASVERLVSVIESHA